MMPPSPELYMSMSQAPTATMMLAVRGEGRPEDLTRPVRAAITAIDPAQPVYHGKTLDRLVRDSLMVRSTSAALMTVFSALALILAAVGVYGVVAYGVNQQARDFGVRMALGATPRDVVRLVLRDGIFMVAAGVLIGGAGALAATRLMAGALHGVSTTDPPTYVAVIAVLAATGLVACSVPAWRASATQPVTALRMD